VIELIHIVIIILHQELQTQYLERVLKMKCVWILLPTIQNTPALIYFVVMTIMVNIILILHFVDLMHLQMVLVIHQIQFTQIHYPIFQPYLELLVVLNQHLHQLQPQHQLQHLSHQHQHQHQLHYVKIVLLLHLKSQLTSLFFFFHHYF